MIRKSENAQRFLIDWEIEWKTLRPLEKFSGIGQPEKQSLVLKFLAALMHLVSTRKV